MRAKTNWGIRGIQFFILAVLVFTGVAVAGTYSGGSGTLEDPYQIGSVADWQELMNEQNDWDKHYILTHDLEFSGVALTPIGNRDSSFSGSIDGKGNILRNHCCPVVEF